MIQYVIVKMLAGERQNVFSVGDDDQSVYGFRGAAPAIMKKFPEDFHGTVIEYLNVNYRCSYDIVECSKRIIQNNRDRYEKQLRSAFAAGQSDRVHIVKTDSMTEQNKKIIDRITELNRAGIPYREMARANNYKVCVKKGRLPDGTVLENTLDRQFEQPKLG